MGEMLPEGLRVLPADTPVPMTVVVHPAEETDDEAARDVVAWIGEVRVGGVTVLTDRYLAHRNVPPALAEWATKEHAIAAFGERLREVLG